MRKLHYNCFAGLCGDMNLGALIDIGVSFEQLVLELKKLNINGWHITYNNDMRKGISGTKVTVHLEENHHDHHHHDHHHHDHHHQHHTSRNFSQIKKLINNSTLSQRIKSNSIAIFQVLADAEGKVHNKPADEVHFHEVGAVDSIIDIVGAAICYELLEVDAVTCSTIELGGGTVKCEHGIMPVPAPATAEILLDVPTSSGADNKECTTPTGAAILKTIVSKFNPKDVGTVIKTGYGIGQRDSENISNSVQILLIDTVENPNDFLTETLFEITATMDDISAEKVSYLTEMLFKDNALDVWQHPVYMKKNRTGIEVTALCKPIDKSRIMECFFYNSTTIGVRDKQINRHSLQRKIEIIDTIYGKIKIKKAFLNGKVVSSKPEFEDVKAAAEKNKVSLKDVYSKISFE